MCCHQLTKTPALLNSSSTPSGTSLALRVVSSSLADLGHLLAAVARMLELGEVVPGNRPPGFEGVVVPGESAQQRRGRFERGLDDGPGVDGLAKGEVGGTLGLEE